MAQLSISEAIRQAPIGRTSFYTKFLDTGLISASVGSDGKKYIESSELVRVFGDKLKSEPATDDRTATGRKKENNPAQPSEQSLLVAQMQRQITDLQQERENYRQQVVTLTARLEPPASPAAQVKPMKRQSRISKWWFGKDD